MVRMRRWITVVIMGSLMFVPGLAQANGVVHIDVDGTGCPAGSTSSNIAPDGQSFTILFDEFFASAGPNDPESDTTKDCLIDVTLETDESVGIAMDTVGFVNVTADMTANQQQHVLSTKHSNQVTHFSAPTIRQYLAHSTATILAQGKPSRKTVTIMLQIEVDKGTNTTDSSLITIDSFDLILH